MVSYSDASSSSSQENQSCQVMDCAWAHVSSPGQLPRPDKLFLKQTPLLKSFQFLRVLFMPPWCIPLSGLNCWRAGVRHDHIPFWVKRSAVKVNVPAPSWKKLAACLEAADHILHVKTTKKKQQPGFWFLRDLRGWTCTCTSEANTSSQGS